MSGVISKRQQARNEKQLQELVQKTVGNSICADCYARNPAWASWSLGVFLCMRCAAIHRKLGTHISKVKSLSMDSWTNEQVDNMRKVGNVASNQIYNPDNKKPPVPIDADEADSAMERFIRQKYIHNVAEQTSKPRSPSSDEGTPPPLPPKNTSKFGLRAAFSRSKTVSEAKTTNSFPLDSPSLTNKPSKVFGATVDYDAPDDTDKKLAKLRDMGFQNNQRNSIVLKGVSGNLDRAVETLVRLGEGDRPPPAPPKEPRERTLRATKSFTPVMPSSTGLNGGLGTVQRPEADRPTTSSTASPNPFDALNKLQPQTAHSTGSMHASKPYSASTNPFASMSAQTSPVDKAFQNLAIFSQHSAVSPSPSSFSLPMPSQQQAYQHSTPTSPQVPQGLGLSSGVTFPFTAQQQQQQQQTSLQPQPTGYNPYFPQSTSPVQQYAGQGAGAMFNTNQASGQMSSNPYARLPSGIASPSPLSQISEQMQTATFSTSPLPLAYPGTNPFFNGQGTPAIQGAQSPFAQQQPQQQMFQQQQQPFQQQSPFQPQHTFQQQNQQQNPYQQYQTPRHDKASIMALYGHSPATQHKAFEPQLQTQTPSIPENQVVDAFSAPHMPGVRAEQPRSFSQPLPGTNPFATSMQGGVGGGGGGGAAATAVDPYKTARQMSRESVNLGQDMAWTNGRHSPDAFASLSARHV